MQRIPSAPGVYLMRDKKGRVLYVGKAKNLRARVRAYFRPGGGDERAFVATGLLGRLVGDVETVVVTNEKEALLLENNLIKEHQPRFNVKLTDDKNFLVLSIDPKQTYPRIEVGRRIGSDGKHYFGPYHSATSCRETLRVLNRHFMLRTCTDHVMATRVRPCIQYQIKRCPAPCVFEVPAAEYAEQVNDTALFLKGKKDELARRLGERMQAAATGLEYERAAQIRDQLRAVESTLTRQTVVSRDFLDQDVIGFHRRDDVVEIAVMFVRDGKLLGRRTFRLRNQEIPDAESVRHFVRSYYELGSPIPDEILVPVDFEDREAMGQWLRGMRGKKSEILFPQRGARAKLLELARRNAEASFASKKAGGDQAAALRKLRQRLALKRMPRRVECYDIAHIQGASTVGSMVVFIDGEPATGQYKRFKVKGATNDDFASMYEVLTRRFRRAHEGNPGWEAPDLVVVDGGKGQLSTAVAALTDLGIDLQATDAFDVIGLAKERAVDVDGDMEIPDRVYRMGIKDPISLRSNSTELYLLARVRDEAHRFANTYHRLLRKKGTLRSSLDDVPGIGHKRKVALLKHFGSLKAIRQATEDELAACPGITRKAAQAVKRFTEES